MAKKHTIYIYAKICIHTYIHIMEFRYGIIQPILSYVYLFSLEALIFVYSLRQKFNCEGL